MTAISSSLRPLAGSFSEGILDADRAGDLRIGKDAGDIGGNVRNSAGAGGALSENSVGKRQRDGSSDANGERRLRCKFGASGGFHGEPVDARQP